MKFNMLRLGEVNSDLKEIEPYIRCVDHLSIDISVISLLWLQQILIHHLME